MNTSSTARVFSTKVGGTVITEPSCGQIGWLETELDQPRVRVLFDRGGIPRRYQQESGHDFLRGFYSAAWVYIVCQPEDFG